MHERFARWVFLVLAVALTVLGRPEGSFDHPTGEETFRPIHDDLTLMSEERRAPGVRSDGERQSKPSAAAPTAIDVVLFDELAIATTFTEIEWRMRSPWSPAERPSTASARGPPATA